MCATSYQFIMLLNSLPGLKAFEYLELQLLIEIKWPGDKRKDFLQHILLKGSLMSNLIVEHECKQRLYFTIFY